MRCDGCDGKFGANGEPTAEVESEDVNELQIDIEVRVDVPCANCGNDWKSGYISLEGEIDVDSHDDECTIDDVDNVDRDGKATTVTLESDPDRFRDLADRDRTFEITETNVEVSDDYRPKYKDVRDRKTKEMKRVPVPHRYQRHYYDVTATCSVRCSACDGSFEVELNEDMTAGELELV